MSELQMHTMYTTSGSKVQVNENSFKHAKSIGWTKTNPKAKKKQEPVEES